MVKGKKKWLYILGLAAFVFYIFISPRPIPEETILKPRWISSLESNYAVDELPSPERKDLRLLPFVLGDRFGYVGEDGKFTINQIRTGYVTMSANNWIEYEALPSLIHVMNPLNEPVFTIEDPKGYPLLLDNRFFIIGKEQNMITALDPAGKELWTYDFSAPITCVDAAGGHLLAGTLAGEVILLNSSGIPVFSPFEPGGSRLLVILGCAISADASRLAIISGIEDQRFLLLEHAGDTYKVVYHEFLSAGFRRPIHISFVDNDSKVVFEREEGLGIYNIGSRSSDKVSLDGEIAALDNSGEDGFLFVVTSRGLKDRRFITIRYPASIVNEAPFKSDRVFFARRDKKLYLSGDSTMASFQLEKK
jgi:hypothetical protein